jgi:hypothetical protein
MNITDDVLALFTDRIDKVTIINNLKSSEEYFDAAVELALGNTQPQSWRAVWIVRQSIEKNDKRIQPYISDFIKIMKDRPEGQQREILKLLEFMEWDEEQEGRLFDICMTIWEKISHKPALRITAFKIMMQIAVRYPELKGEMEVFMGEDYTDTLSPGIKRSFEKMYAKLL